MKTELYLLSTDSVGVIPDSYAEKHFPVRYKRANRFLKNEDRLRCIGAGVLLYEVLGIREDNILETEHGKPYVKNPPIGFNLSHSGKYVLLATDEREVGADIEKADASHLSVAESLCSDEYSWLSENPVSRFYTVWTLKESVMKQLGLGFYLPPQSFSVLPLICGKPLNINGKTLYGHTLEYDGHMVSVCCEHPIEEVSLHILTEKDLKM